MEKITAKKIIPGEIRKIAVINLGGIGDLLLSTPALRALRNAYPDGRIILLVSLGAFEFAKGLTCIDSIFVLRFSVSPVAVIANIKTLLALRKEKLDLAVNMRTLVSQMSAFKMRLLLGIIGPKIKAGRDTQGRGWFFDVRIAEEDIGETYEMDYDIETAEALGARVTDETPDFKVREEDSKEVKFLLDSSGVSADNIIVGIHPGGKPSHRWPAANFIETMKRIADKRKCAFVITGEKGDALALQGLMCGSDIKVIDLTGKLNIRQLGALIGMCGVYISGDTGPMHIAAALKTPQVAIFGPGYLSRFNPRHINEKAVTLYEKQACAPCNKTDCRFMKCLKGVLPERVAQAALGLLKPAETHERAP